MSCSFCFAVVAQKAELTRTVQRKSCSFCQSLTIPVVLLSCQQAKMYWGFQSIEKCCTLLLPSPLPTFYLFHTIHTDGVIYLNRLKSPFFITLLFSAYSLKLFSECKRKGTEGTQDVAAEAGNCSWWKSERNLHRPQTVLDWLNVSSSRPTSQCYLGDNDYIPQEFLQHCFFLFTCLLSPPPPSFSKLSISKTEKWIFLLP